MPVSRILVPQFQHTPFPPIPVLPVRVVGPTGPTGASGGVSATIVTAKLTPSGATGSMTFTNGRLTAHVDAT